MLEEKHEGIVLRSTPYKDQQKIITLFTPQKGVLSLIVKGISKKKAHLLTLTSPFTHGEYHMLVGRSSLYTFQDATIFHTHFSLRKQLEHLQAATALVQALLQSQYPGKSAPALYQLTLAYLGKLPEFANPTTITASFLLKVLKHDGLLSLQEHCTACANQASHLHLGEPFCSSHTPPSAFPLSPSERALLLILVGSKSFTQLKTVMIPPLLFQKIEAIFKENYH